MQFPQFTFVSDHGVLVEFGEVINDEVHARVIALDKMINAKPPKGVLETVPAFVNLMVVFDPLMTDHQTLSTVLQNMVENLKTVDNLPNIREVLVCYDADLAPDLSTVADKKSMSTEAVINAHLNASYEIAMFGFAPGYAYMAGVPQNIQLPRKTVPVRDVAAGSVIIAGPQCLVTTITMPAGWWNIGRSPTKILLDNPDRPLLFDTGDKVQFKRIDRAEFEALRPPS